MIHVRTILPHEMDENDVRDLADAVGDANELVEVLLPTGDRIIGYYIQREREMPEDTPTVGDYNSEFAAWSHLVQHHGFPTFFRDPPSAALLKVRADGECHHHVPVFDDAPTQTADEAFEVDDE